MNRKAQILVVLLAAAVAVSGAIVLATRRSSGPPSSQPIAQRTIRDMTDRPVNFPAQPQRILSLCTTANVVFVPGLVDLDQVEAIAAWLGALRRDIPFHIMGYIPVPGQLYERPTTQQMEMAVRLCQKYLDKVNQSHLSSQDALDLTSRDDRFEVRRIA